MKRILLKMITLIHVLYVLFVLLTPFIDSNYLLLLHVTMLPFMMLHWVCNNNACFLVVVEKATRKIIYGKSDKKDCITCKIFEPIYDFNKNHKAWSKTMYSIVTILWLLRIGKIFYKYKSGELKHYMDLFIL